MAEREERLKREDANARTDATADKSPAPDHEADVERAANEHIKRNKKALTELSKW